MRAIWALAAAVLAAAILAAAWPRRDAPPAEPLPAEAPASTAPVPAAPASAKSGALDEYLGGTLAASSMPANPSVSVGEPARIERVDDRTVRIDGSFLVRGSGTESDPFQVSWEYLGSARATVDAERGMFVVPGRIADLRGTWVRISGYWAPPLLVFEAREAMVMLNKWDGCCIGLPPTPFDSIEATFAAPLKVEGQHLFRYGTFKGRLQVEPFVAGTFLLGFYRLEDAVMESSS